jgi:SAM-dependent methyltransferase
MTMAGKGSPIEGLGVVYERLILNDILEEFDEQYPYQTTLEAPIYGMAGVDGINSVHLAQRGKDVTLLDVDADRVRDVDAIWRDLGLPVHLVLQSAPRRLPFESDAFDLVWNFAALWHVKGAGQLIQEMVRVSNDLIFVAMPNKTQIGYILRKYAIDKEFFDQVDERWISISLIKQSLKAAGCEIVREGVMDVPPWPDTCMPASEFLRRMGIRSAKLQSRFDGDGWKWSTLDYYSGRAPQLRQTVDKLAVLDRARLPWRVKTVWAHHHYVLARKGA